jgi:clan AA aspartic protease
MTGIVDDFGRALLRLKIRHTGNDAEKEMDVWIDTGFTGELVVPEEQVKALGLPLGQGVKAILADGSEIQLNTYPCGLMWFDEWKEIEVIANQGQTPLLGIGMLRDRILTIDYPRKTLTVE